MNIRLLNDAGKALGDLQDGLYRNLKTKLVQVDDERRTPASAK
jgi:hypothetical protein